MPTANHHSVEARPGDWIEVGALAVGQPGRRGQILEIVGPPGHERYRVRWDEKHESIVYPADGAARVIRHRATKRPRAAIADRRTS